MPSNLEASHKVSNTVFTHKFAASYVKKVRDDLPYIDFRKDTQVELLGLDGKNSCIRFEHLDAYETGWVESELLIPLRINQIPDLPHHLMVGDCFRNYCNDLTCGSATLQWVKGLLVSISQSNKTCSS